MNGITRDEKLQQELFDAYFHTNDKMGTRMVGAIKAIARAEFEDIVATEVREVPDGLRNAMLLRSRQEKARRHQEIVKAATHALHDCQEILDSMRVFEDQRYCGRALLMNGADGAINKLLSNAANVGRCWAALMVLEDVEAGESQSARDLPKEI